MLISKKSAYKNLTSRVPSKTFRISGFTMVEIIVTLAILSTSMLAIFGVLRMCSAAQDNCQQYAQAVLLAEKLLSQTSLKKTLLYQTIEGTEGKFNFQIETTATDTDNLSAVCIKIKWYQNQKEQNYSLFSLIPIPNSIQSNDY